MGYSQGFLWKLALVVLIFCVFPKAEPARGGVKCLPTCDCDCMYD